MNGKKSKTLRKRIYGDYSTRSMPLASPHYVKDHAGAIRSTGLRQKYQEEKRMYRNHD
jgi:hypothetical protein